MDNNFITYKKFNDPALAEDLVVLLQQHGIAYSVEEDKLSFDPAFSHRDLQTDYLVKLCPEDFVKADSIVDQNEKQFVNEVDQDHYLFGFTNDELTDVILKADEWSNFDVVLARKILAERGTDIDDKTIAIINQSRLEDLKAPTKSQSSLVFLGYATAILGGIISVIIGWHLINAKKTLPNGERIYVYNEGDRSNGNIIFWLGIVLVAIWVAIRFVMVSRSY